MAGWTKWHTIVHHFLPAKSLHPDCASANHTLSQKCQIIMPLGACISSLVVQRCKVWAHLKVAKLKNNLRCYPQQLESFCVFATKSAYAIRIKRLCHKCLNPFPITKRSQILKTRVSPSPSLENFRLANLTFNWFPLENSLKIKLPFVGFAP